MLQARTSTILRKMTALKNAPAHQEAAKLACQQFTAALRTRFAQALQRMRFCLCVPADHLPELVACRCFPSLPDNLVLRDMRMTGQLLYLS